MQNAREVVTVRPSDPEFLEATRLRSRVLYEPFGISPTFDFDDASPHAVHVIAIERGDVVGYARLDLMGDTAHVRHLCVDPSRQRQGIGGELLGELVERARARGASLAYLNARFTALGLYRRHGFEEVGPVFHTEHTHLPHKRMERKLA